MQSNKKLFIVIGILTGVLMLLVLISLIFRPSTQQTVDQTKITPILLPQTGSLEQNAQLQNPLIKDPATLSPDQQNKLQNLSRRVPVNTTDFDMDYSPVLNKFFVDTKTPQGSSELNEFLRDNGAPGLAAEVPDLFTFSDGPPGEQIQQAESQVLALIEEADLDSTQSTSSLTQDLQLFSDVSKTLFTLDLGASPATGGTPTTGSTQSCDVGTDAGDATTFQGTTIHLCRVQGITVNSIIATNVNNLLNDARSGGISLSGGGFRSYTAQIAVRKRNCGTSHYDIYEKPSSQCRPPTARPGQSMHEQGLAIDFTYQNALIRSSSNQGFVWLSQNASKYALINFPKEPWHWSTNGR